MWYQIIGGPGKFDLMVSLFDGDSAHRKWLEFTLEGPSSGRPPISTRRTIKVLTSQVEREDNSGESWNLVVMTGQYRVLSMYYNTQTRKGKVQLIDY